MPAGSATRRWSIVAAGGPASGSAFRPGVDLRTWTPGSSSGPVCGARSPEPNWRPAWSSFVEFQERQTLHWGYYSDSLHWRDTTTYRSVDHSGPWQTAQTSLRWRYGLMEVNAIGGVTIGPSIQPRHWAQAVVNVQAS